MQRALGTCRNKVKAYDSMPLLMRKTRMAKNGLSEAIEGGALAMFAARTGLPASRSDGKGGATGEFE